MKPVLPRLAEFGEDDEREAEGLGTTGGSSQRSQGHKRCSNRPQVAPHRNTQAPITASPSTINLCCTTALKPPDDHDRKSHKMDGGATHGLQGGATVGDYEDLRQLWESQKHTRVGLAADLTLTGQAPALVRKQPTLLTLDTADTDTPTDGNTQWTAVTLRPTHSVDGSEALACLLLCKRVPKELPQVNIADWKPGTVGIPTFHCQRCCRHWFKRGNLPVDCKELEDITEGPAMCFAIADKNSGNSKIIVQGILGEDGKPVRVKVKDVSQLQKMMRRKKKRRIGRKRAGGRCREGKSSADSDTDAEKNRRSSNCYGASTEDDSTDASSFLDTSDSDEISPKSVQQYILRKSKHRRRRKKMSGVKPSPPDSEVSSLSDFLDSDVESVVDREHNGNQKQSKMKRRRRISVKVHNEQSTTNEDCASGNSSSQVGYSESGNHERQVSIRSKGKHKRRAGKLRENFHSQIKISSTYLQEPSSTDEDSQENSSNMSQGEQGTSIIGRGSAGPTVHPNKPWYSGRERCYNSGGSFHLPNIADTSSPGGNPHHHHTRRGSVESTSPTLNDSTHLPQLCNKNNSIMQQQGSLEKQIEAFSRRQSTVTGRRESTLTGRRESTVTSRGLTRGQTPNIQGNNGQQNLLDGHKLRRDAMRRVGRDRRRSSVAQWTMNPQMTADSEDPSSASGVDGMHHHSATQVSDVVTKTATIKENVYLPNKMPNMGSKKVKGKQKKKKLNAAEAPRVKAQMLPETNTGASCPITNTGASRPVTNTGASRPVTTDQVSAQTNLHASATIDEVPRRYGRKIVKKTRKEADRRQSIIHNSKDLGNLIGHREQETAYTDSSGKDHRQSLTQEESLTSNTEQHGRSLKSAYRKVTESGLVPPLQGALNKSSVVDTRLRPSSIAPQLVEERSSGGALEELTSGLGAKFNPNVSTQHLGRFSTPVQLKPLKNSQAMFPPQVPITTQGIDQNSEISSAKENTIGTEDNSTKNAERVVSSSRSHDSGLEVLTEEDTEMESEDEEPALPPLELEPISALSFTSPYSFSLFPMAPQYQEAYERVRKRALQPLRIIKRKLQQPRKR